MFQVLEVNDDLALLRLEMGTRSASVAAFILPDRQVKTGVYDERNALAWTDFSSEDEARGGFRDACVSRPWETRH